MTYPGAGSPAGGIGTSRDEAGLLGAVGLLAVVNGPADLHRLLANVFHQALEVLQFLFWRKPVVLVLRQRAEDHPHPLGDYRAQGFQEAIRVIPGTGRCHESDAGHYGRMIEAY